MYYLMYVWKLFVVYMRFLGPFYSHGLIPASISYYNHHTVWDEICYFFPNLNGCIIKQ